MIAAHPQKNNFCYMNRELILKYNVPAPRYTSYPTVPFWKNNLTEANWKNSATSAFHSENKENGISLYIHLPYCESLCTYCGCNTRITVNHNVEKPYIETLLKEWKMYVKLFYEKPVISEIHLGGGTPAFFSAENLHCLVSGILADSEIHTAHSFSFEAHPGNTTRQHLNTLFSLGFRRISIGVQDADEKVLQAIHRKQTWQQVQSLAEDARKTGFTSVNFDIVYGLPFQNAETQKKLLEKIISLHPERIAYYSYAHVPWIKKAQRSFTENDLPSAEIKMELYLLGKEMLLRKGYEDIGMDHFALPADELSVASKNKTLHRNFMGYTTTSSKLLIGLGVSAISDSWTAFKQNDKIIENWMEKINAGKYSVQNGHLLTKHDLAIRKKILELMCRFETDISSTEQNELRVRMGKYVKDGLMEWAGSQIIVTEKGKQFIRNICMELDDYLPRTENDRQLFSKAV